MVSVMLSGAGSVDCPPADFGDDIGDFRKLRQSGVLARRDLGVFLEQLLGSAIGMNIRSPSLSGGMNSLPIPGARANAPTKRPTAAVMVRARCASALCSTGR